MAAPAFRRTCRLCRISCISVPALCDHVMGEKHRTNLQQSSPEQVKEIGRVQYFLDTHLGEEPLLGLEYIVEEQLCFSYSYACRLCNVEECNWLEAVLHILDTDHMTCYIDYHHRELSLTGKKYPSQADYLRDLRLAALAIYKKGGNKKIQVYTTGLTCLDPTKVSPKDIDAKTAVLLPQGKSIDVELTQVTPQLVSQKRAFSKTVTKQKVDSRKEGSTSDSSKGLRAGPYSCTVCNVFPFTVTDLCKHIMGFKHRQNISRTVSVQQLEKDKLQYLLDNYMKEEPILGLEYIFEEQIDPTLCSYTCQLCNVKHSLYQTYRHILSNSHIFHYITKHHKELLNTQIRSLSGYPKNLRKAAFEVHESYGRKKIQAKKAEKPEVGTLTSKVNVIQEVDFTWTDGSLSDFKMIGSCFCNLCNLAFESYKSLCHHLMQKKHRMTLQSTTPEQLKELGRLNYLLDMHLKDYPILGLEYIVEMQVSCVYVYSCQLCSVKGDWCHIPVHLTGIDHLERYINKHHSELSIKPELFSQKEDYDNVVRANAYKIFKKFGRKEILLEKDVENPAKVTKRPLQFQSRKSDTALSFSAGSQLQSSPKDEMSSIQELEFRRNDEFFDYLNNFVIEDQEDALIIRQIALNCANALVRFGKEQLPGEKL